jgi:hypothetical protein
MGPHRLLSYFVLGFLILLVAAFAYRIRRRGVVLRGLLADKLENTTDGRRITPERVLLLAVAVALSGWYLGEVVLSGGATVPGVNVVWLAVFGASCAIYAVMKAVRTFGIKSSK